MDDLSYREGEGVQVELLGEGDSAEKERGDDSADVAGRGGRGARWGTHCF